MLRESDSLTDFRHKLILFLKEDNNEFDIARFHRAIDGC